jgi:hypothetical protein
MTFDKAAEDEISGVIFSAPAVDGKLNRIIFRIQQLFKRAESEGNNK